MEAVNNPEDAVDGHADRAVFAGALHRAGRFPRSSAQEILSADPGQEVRLRWGYLVRCTGAVKDPKTGEVMEVHCTYDPETRGGNTPDGRKVKGTIHWVSAAHAVKAEVRLYDSLFTKPNPDDVPEGSDYQANLNPKFAGSACRMLRRAEFEGGRAWKPIPVRAAGIFLRRHRRFHAGKAGLQSHGDVERHLGEDRKGTNPTRLIIGSEIV